MNFAVDPEAAPTAGMRAVMERLAREDAGLPDAMTLDAAGARSLAEETNARWNTDLPPLEEARSLIVPENAELDTPAQRARLYRPSGARGLILYVHGGGWANCSLKTHERAMRVLAIGTGMSVIGTDYRLAPEHPFPRPLQDCVAAWRSLREMADLRFDGGPMAVAGDFAGANLALGLMLHEHAEARPLPDFGLLFYGVYFDGGTSPSHRAYGDGRFGLSTAKMNRYWDWYVPEAADRRNPLAVPLGAPDDVLRALPPLFLNAAGLDPLLSDTLALAERLNALGRKDRVRVHEGVIHGFMQMTAALAEAKAAHRAAADFCRSMLTDTKGG